MSKFQEIKIGLLLSAFILGVVSLVYPCFEPASFIIDLAVFFLYVNEIPAILNRFYRTKLFKQKKSLRFSIMISFLIMYLIFAIYLGGSLTPLLMPQTPLYPEFSNIVTPLFFSVLLFALVMALVVSLEVRKCPELTNTIIRRMDSQKQYEADAYEMTHSKIGSYSGTYSTGLVIEALALFLFCFWFLTTLLTPLLLLVIALWIVHDILSLRNKDLQHRVASAIATSDAKIETTIGWKGILRPLLSGSNTAPISILVFLCYGIFTFFIVSFVASPFLLLLFWALSCFWYLFLLLICITSRLSTELHLLSHPDQPARVMRLPPKKDAVAILTTLGAFTLVVLVLVPALVNVYTAMAFLLFSTITNVAALVSVALYVKRRTYRERENAEQHSFKKDRTRLILISLVASITISALTNTHIVIEFVAILVLVQILWKDLYELVDGWRPLPHALAFATFNLLILSLITIALAFFELSGIRPFESFIQPLAATSLIIFLLSIPTSYHAQKFKLRRRNSTQQGVKNPTR